MSIILIDGELNIKIYKIKVMYIQALKIAYEAHNGQYRKQSCVPYIVHPLRVAGYFSDDTKKTIAILHDIIEDTDTTKEDIEILFGKRISEVVDILSKRKGETYFEYIKRVKKDELAIEIKIADIVDNLSDTLCVQQKSMIDRYNKSLLILTK